MSKKIDWTKPVRIVEHGNPEPAKVIATFKDQAFVTWGTESTAHATDCYGHIVSMPDYKIENVPEELYLRVCRQENGSYTLDGAGTGEHWEGYDEKQALPRGLWKKYYGSSMESERAFLVKVPV